MSVFDELLYRGIYALSAVLFEVIKSLAHPERHRIGAQNGIHV